MTAQPQASGAARHHVVIIGSGFGGLFAAKALRRADVDVTVVSKTAYHLFQPLLYQVATGILSEGEVAPAAREILRRQKNTDVLLGEVTEIDLQARTVTFRTLPAFTKTITYDSLIVTAGAGQSYFGNEAFAEFAPGLKSIDDALELRARIFGSFEIAELQDDPDLAREWMTFVVVGAGATGVEMAGQIAELARDTLRKDYRHIDPRQARVILVDALPVVLPTFHEKLQKAAAKRLRKFGVELQLGVKVVDMDAGGVEVEESDGSRRRIPTWCKVWAAGIAASPLGRQLAEQAGAETDRSGRVKVNPDLTLPGHPEVFLVGDLIALDQLPGVAQVAMQGGKHASKQIVRRLKGQETGQPFHYRDKGNLATVSRFHAVADIRGLRFAGFPGWLVWLAVHIFYLIGFKNRVTTLFHWAITFISRGRSERTATVQQVFARTAMRREAERAAAEAAGAPGAAAADLGAQPARSRGGTD
jgi:NADH dehydrogenase